MTASSRAEVFSATTSFNARTVRFCDAVAAGSSQMVRKSSAAIAAGVVGASPGSRQSSSGANATPETRMRSHAT